MYIVKKYSQSVPDILPLLQGLANQNIDLIVAAPKVEPV